MKLPGSMLMFSRLVNDICNVAVVVGLITTAITFVVTRNVWKYAIHKSEGRRCLSQSEVGITIIKVSVGR